MQNATAVTTRARRNRRNRRVYALLSLTALVAASAGCPGPTTNLQPAPVASVEITTPKVTVMPPPNGTAPTKFKLSVRLWKANHEVIAESEGKDPEWHAFLGDEPIGADGGDPMVRFVNKNGHEVVLEVLHFPPIPVEVKVRVKVDGVWSDPDALITLVDYPTPPGTDVITSNQVEAGPPSLTLVDGLTDGGNGGSCFNDKMFVFVHAVLPGNFVWGCGSDHGEVTVFSFDKALYHEHSQSWQVAEEVLDVRDLQKTLLTLPVKIWLRIPSTYASPADSLLRWTQQAITDVEIANDILQSNQTGVVLSIVGQFPQQISGEDRVYQCEETTNYITSSILNVFYVPMLSGVRGESCGRTESRPEAVIYISSLEHTPTTLVHEIGHVLSLLTPGPWGHTGELNLGLVESFRSDNVMWSGLDHTTSRHRQHFSLGQAFRLNVDQWSWVNHSAAASETDRHAVAVDGTPARPLAETRLACQCAINSKNPCPSLVAGLSDDDVELPTYDPWSCADEVKLLSTNQDHSGVGLMFGKLKASPPDDCDWLKGFPARRYDGGTDSEGWLRLWFPNLTSYNCGGSTDWRLAVFFDEHRMWYLQLPSDNFTYRYNDWWHLNDAPQERWRVPVNLWFEGDIDDYQDIGVTSANQVFGTEDAGGTNRSGIFLKWNTHGQPNDWEGVGGLRQWLSLELDPGQLNPCSQLPTGIGSPKIGEINVYYVGESTNLASDFAILEEDRGAWCTDGNGTYFIVLAPPLAGSTISALPYTKTALSHHLGHVFSLRHVSDEDGLTWSNIMWDYPYPAGLDARSELTLGQVFRLNLDPGSWLNSSTTSDRDGQPTVTCAPGTDDCPSIDMHITVEEEQSTIWGG